MIAFATAVAFAASAAAFAPAASAAQNDGVPPITENGGAARNDGDRTQALRDAIIDGPAKNVIFLIGDGMGDSEITVARNYAEGADGSFAGIDALPLTGSYTTFSVTKDGKVDYASESASTASAWSTGTKAVDGSLSVDFTGKPQATLLELAKANGLKTGNVSTAEIQDATPGAEVAHISQRGCYGPVKTTANCSSEALENGGLGSISEQLLNVRPDVTLGGGSASFNENAAAGPWKGQTLFAQAQSRGYQVVGDSAGLAGITAADQTKPLLGLFTPGNFPVRYAGPAATVGGGAAAAQACTENPGRLASGLSLGAMTSKAIDLLKGDKGFFLQVEGASIDKQNHAANACGQIGETVDLDEAVQVALDFAKTNGDTMVVVTADHAHTSQIVGEPTPGLSVNLLTEEGVPMIVAYGTGAAGSSQQHTGAQVRVAGYGPGAANVVGLTDQTDLFFTASRTLKLNSDLASLSAGATASPSATEVAPGAEVTVTAAGLNADWQTTATLASTPTDLGQRDVINGAAVYTFTAPTEPGAHTVTIKGAQTGKTVVANFTVTANPASPSPTATAAGALAGSGSESGPTALGSTGGVVPIALLTAALAAIALGALFVRRRRAGHLV